MSSSLRFDLTDEERALWDNALLVSLRTHTPPESR